MRCLLYTSDAADERSSVDLGGRRIIKKNNIRIDRTGVDVLLDRSEVCRSIELSMKQDNERYHVHGSG